MKVVNKEEFKEVSKQGLVLVDFYAEWCGPCKMLGPVLEEVSKQYENVTFVKVNVDEEQDLAAEYGVMSIPSVFLLKDGQKVGSFMGFQTAEKVTEFLNKNV